jgi:hypothetical protein
MRDISTTTGVIKVLKGCYKGVARVLPHKASVFVRTYMLVGFMC